MMTKKMIKANYCLQRKIGRKELGGVILINPDKDVVGVKVEVAVMVEVEVVGSKAMKTERIKVGIETSETPNAIIVKNTDIMRASVLRRKQKNKKRI
ncbi:hypothetical protein Hanom_Chr12g01098591 [Helianthus anomalus]